MKNLEQKYPGIGAFWEEMGRTPQNPSFLGEGDVLTHTRLVVEALTKLESFQRLHETQKEILFLAAALHDAGKPITTRTEDGAWVSPHHGAAGAQLVRSFLWKDCGLCGTSEKQAFREGVCSLIRHHTLSIWKRIGRPTGSAIGIGMRRCRRID